MSLLGFTPAELFPYLGIVIFISIVLISNYRRSYMHFWSPMTVLTIIFIYYSVVGPLWAISTDNTYDRLLNLREFYPLAFWGALTLLVSFATGFGIGRSSMPLNFTVNYREGMLREYGIKLSLIGFILFTISTGGNVGRLINPLDAEVVEQVGGSFGNYLGLSLNFLIPGACLLFLHYVSTKRGFILLLVVLLITTGIFVSIGFRYRLVLLFGSLAISYFLYVRRRPNIILSLLSVALFVTLMGIINITRQYGQGLDTTLLERQAAKDSYYESGLRESLIFQTSGAMIGVVPEKHPHAGLTPIISTVLFPIPRSLYPEKKSAEYLFNALDAIYGKKYSQGSAVMAYGEYYLAFGWFGIIAGGLITGWLCRRLWNWYLSNPTNPMHICAYAVSISYLYVVVSRGYLPQVTMLFFFTVFPIIVVLRLARRKYGSRPKRVMTSVA
jgi:oligosaccharide repeat unit polymerase